MKLPHSSIIPYVSTVQLNFDRSIFFCNKSLYLIELGDWRTFQSSDETFDSSFVMTSINE